MTPLSPGEFVLLLLLGGLVLLLGLMIPVQLQSKLRRIRKARTHRTCRICGYRFLLRDSEPEVHCPHCGAEN